MTDMDDTQPVASAGGPPHGDADRPSPYPGGGRMGGAQSGGSTPARPYAGETRHGIGGVWARDEESPWPADATRHEGQIPWPADATRHEHQTPWPADATRHEDQIPWPADATRHENETPWPADGTRRQDEPEDDAPPQQVTMRFGPGVPPTVAERWRQRGRPRRSPWRRVAGALLTLALAVLAGVVVWWLLRSGGPAVKVTGVSVRAPSAVQRCDATVRIVGTIRTNGGSGEISYRWRRSDGQVSGVFTDTVHKGQKSIRVPLRWTVKGTGRLHAVATLEIVEPANPSGGSASAAFDYACG